MGNGDWDSVMAKIWVLESLEDEWSQIANLNIPFDSETSLAKFTFKKQDREDLCTRAVRCRFAYGSEKLETSSMSFKNGFVKLIRIKLPPWDTSQL